jgi:hypothetical protein
VVKDDELNERETKEARVRIISNDELTGSNEIIREYELDKISNQPGFVSDASGQRRLESRVAVIPRHEADTPGGHPLNFLASFARAVSVYAGPNWFNL